MKYEKVYEAMGKLVEIKKDLNLEGSPSNDKYISNSYQCELDRIIDMTIESLQAQLSMRARELQMEGLISKTINPINVVSNLLDEIDKSFENNNEK